jgi:hypothetical protein
LTTVGLPKVGGVDVSFLDHRSFNEGGSAGWETSASIVIRKRLTLNKQLIYSLNIFENRNDREILNPGVHWTPFQDDEIIFEDTEY